MNRSDFEIILVTIASFAASYAYLYTDIEAFTIAKTLLRFAIVYVVIVKAWDLHKKYKAKKKRTKRKKREAKRKNCQNCGTTSHIDNMKSIRVGNYDEIWCQECASQAACDNCGVLELQGDLYDVKVGNHRELWCHSCAQGSV
jgi:hypothetical protein